MKGHSEKLKRSAGNISTPDMIFAYVFVLQDKIRGILKYRRTYRDYFNVIMHIIMGKYPFQATLRNGQPIVLNNHFAVSVIGDSEGSELIECDVTNDVITIFSSPNIGDDKLKVKLYGGVYDGDVLATFLSNRYEFLPVKRRIVIDIGANIGDTAIFFALSGANRVISIEPFPKNYELAKKNIESNNLSDRITLMLAGCASNSSYITIDPEYNSNARSVLGDDFKHGIKVPLLTLDDILTQNDLSLPNGRGNIILKMDCEGCEYQTILSASESTLQCFSHIFIEYHDGYKNLKERLEKAGFIVSVSRPIMVKDHDYFYTSHFVGYLYAKRDNDTNEI